MDKIDELTRENFLGVISHKIKLDSRQSRECQSGFMVEQISDESPAEKFDIRVEDIILKIEDYESEKYDTLIELLKIVGKKNISITILRGCNIITIAVILQMKPLEQRPDFDIIYSSFAICNARLRMIITKPKGTNLKFPTLFFIQGGYCNSIDFPFTDSHPYKKLIYKFTQLGYATVRVERYGTGDSEGPRCEDINFEQEVGLFDAALKHVKNIEYLDSNRLFLFGYSLGGVVAPILAVRNRDLVKGIVVFGTSTVRYSDYWIKNLVRQHRLKGIDPCTIEEQVKETMDFLTLLFEEQLTPNEIINLRPEYESFFSKGKYIFGRHYAFFQQLEKCNVMDYWDKINIPVVIVAGKRDYVADYQDHLHLYEFLVKNNTVPLVKLLTPEIDHSFHTNIDVEGDFFSYSTVEDICGYLNGSFSNSIEGCTKKAYV